MERRELTYPYHELSQLINEAKFAELKRDPEYLNKIMYKIDDLIASIHAHTIISKSIS